MTDQKQPVGESKYAIKRRSGRMMYGPLPTVPKYPNFRARNIHHEIHE